jgi:hypothetical protein
VVGEDLPLGEHLLHLFALALDGGGIFALVALLVSGESEGLEEDGLEGGGRVLGVGPELPGERERKLVRRELLVGAFARRGRVGADLVHDGRAPLRAEAGRRRGERRGEEDCDYDESLFLP